MNEVDFNKLSEVMFPKGEGIILTKEKAVMYGLRILYWSLLKRGF